MVEPAAGGQLGAAGLLVFDKLLQAAAETVTLAASTAIRKIGVHRLSKEKVAPKTTHGRGNRY